MVFLGTLVVFALTFARTYTHVDTHAATVESWRIAATGTPWLEDSMDELMEQNPFIVEAPNGHTVGMRMAGPEIAGIPFYWVIDRAADMTHFSVVPGGIAAATVTAVAVLLIFLALRTRLGNRLSLAAATVFAFGTPTWSISANMLWTHTVTQLGLAGAAYAASRSRWWQVGFFCAVAMLGRPHLALVAAILGIGMAWTKKDMRPLVQIGLPSASALGLLLIWNHWLTGIWTIAAGYGGKAEAAASGFQGNSEWSGRFPQLTNYLGFFFSFDRGFLVWTPVILLLLPAIWRARRSIPEWSKLLAAGGLVYSLVQLRINWFPGGDGFYGYRHGLELLTCITPLAAFALPWVGSLARRLLPILASIQVGAIMLGAVTESFLLEKADVWSDNSLWLALREVPAVVVPWMLIWAVIGIFLSLMVERRMEDPRELGWPRPVTFVES